MEIINGVPMISVDEICWCCDMTHKVQCEKKDCEFYKLSGEIMYKIIRDEKDEND